MLSPYLFALCMEVLAQHINVLQRQWQVIQLSKGGPKISHLFFADDMILFGSANANQAKIVEQVLKNL